MTVRSSWRFAALASCTMALAAACLITARAAHAQPAASTASLAGAWVFAMEGDGQPQRVQLVMENDSLRGRVYGQAFAAVLRNGQLRFAVGSYRWRATLAGDSLVGWLGVDPDSSRWSAVRERPSRAARRNVLEATTWARSYAVTTPVARLVQGDTVATNTLDAGGWGRGAFGDRTNKKSVGGNPLVGPFYVEHALPGDVLEITLHKVRLNRDWAFSGTWLMDNGITPSYAAERKPTNGRVDDKWVLDTMSGTARRADTTGALSAYRVPLTPFLGVVATAPADDHAPSSRDAGAYGGNMENRYMREGTTVLLPVRQRGAYFYLGDGHAAQGDGELTGDAMETSLDVEFSVKVRKWGFQDLVRAETPTHILSHGVGGSVDEAMKRATSDLARWLENSWKLSSAEAAIVLGFSVQYEIADVVAPAYGVIARLPKSALPAVKR